LNLEIVFVLILKNVKDRMRSIRAEINPKMRLTWRGRDTRLHKKLANHLKGSRNGDLRVTDLGAGISDGVSPVAEGLLERLRRDGLEVRSYNAVDREAKNGRVRGIRYFGEDALEHLRKDNNRPNLIIMQRLLKHMEKEDPKRAGELAKLAWKKLPVGGTLVTDAHFDVGPLHIASAPVIVQKTKQGHRLVYSKIGESTSKKVGLRPARLRDLVAERFSPERYRINLEKEIGDEFLTSD
jgi:hypothetical protein